MATDRGIAPSQARTSAFVSDDIDNISESVGLILTFDVTALTGTSVVAVVQGKDPASGKYYTLASSATVTSPGTKTLFIYPATPTSGTGFDTAVPSCLPRTFRVSVTHNSVTTATYSIGATLVGS